MHWLLAWRVLRRAVRSWWTVGTGAASVAGVLVLPTTVVVGRTVLVTTVLVLVLVFAIAVSAACEVRDVSLAPRAKVRLLAWHYRERQALFVLAHHPELELGCVVELIRHDAELEIPFALVELASRTTDGNLQGRALWIAPAHLRDYRTQRFGLGQIRVTTTPSGQAVRAATRLEGL
ncbi:MAG: hypothetical protein ABI877_12240 [Gemmatimonadaceae bacterium]